MKQMKLSRKAGPPVKNTGAESLLNLCKNDPSISEEDKKSLMSLLAGAVENEKRQGTEDEVDEGDDEVSEVAKSMGQETIDMLSNASMRYCNVRFTAAIASNSSSISLQNTDRCMPCVAHSVHTPLPPHVRCGGCGSKVGAQVLSRALSKIRKLLHTREEVIAGIGGKTGDIICAAIARQSAGV
jgi:hypothetical protein